MVDKLIEIALAEVGYLEKKSKDNLDSKTANAGDKNYTKYARDMGKYNVGIYANGYAWCDTFVDWLLSGVLGTGLPGLGTEHLPGALLLMSTFHFHHVISISHSLCQSRISSLSQVVVQ